VLLTSSICCACWPPTIASRGTVCLMSARDVPPCEVAISCCGIASTMALPPLCQVAPAGVTAPRTLDTLFSEVTTDGACPAAGIQTGTVVSVPLGKPSACSARRPAA